MEAACVTLNKLQMTMLLDFYGELLTEKQREYYDLYHNEDLSLSEIAENVGITRQGVHDIIVRAENTLLETERKTGLIKRFSELQAELSKALALAEEIRKQAENENTAALASQLVELLAALKG
jgi:predicted DNA-binding protein YlxM (UPF0122 family)